MAIVIKDKDGRLMQYQDGVLTPLPDQGAPSGQPVAVSSASPQSAPVVQAASSKQSASSITQSPTQDGDVSVSAPISAPELDLPEPSHEALRSRLQTMLTTIEREIGVVYTDKKLEERFRSIMSLRLRGVRNARETVEALQKPKSIGGLELNASQTDMVTRVLEGKVADFTAMWKEEELQKLKKLEADRAEQKHAQTERQQEEVQNQLDKKIQKIAQEKGSIKAQKAVVLDKLIRAEAGRGDSILADLRSRSKEKTKSAPTRPLGQVDGPDMVSPASVAPQESKAAFIAPLPASPASQSVEVSDSLPASHIGASPSRQEQKKSDQHVDKVREERQGNPEDNRRGTASYAERPRMVDVRSGHALMGPLDEIGSMTLKDFRLLAAQPHDAGLKLRSKIDNLEAEHYGMRLAGLTALWGSPLMRLYGNVVVQSLAQKIAIDQAVARQADIQSPGLSLDEFRVLLDLSTELRF